MSELVLNTSQLALTGIKRGESEGGGGFRGGNEGSMKSP